MATREMSRRQKAFTLIPIALVSGGWVVSMAGFGSADAAGSHHDGTLPDGTTVPSKAIEAPANVPVTGQIAPGVPDGDADSIAAGASTSGIPSAALSAYQRAAQIIDAADTSCQLPWELIAAIGRVESDHGRYAGNVLSTNGISRPGVFGPVLNGQDGTQAIKDTDAGELDQDPAWDRAVGPMQFIPSTWQVVKVDADGDGQRNPQDINDAALATSVYLCSGSDDLSQTAGQKTAVFRYNHSEAYVDLVLRIMQAYQSGDYTAVPDGASGGQTFSYPAGGYNTGSGTKAPKTKIKKTNRAGTPSAAPGAPKPTSASGGGGNNNAGGGGAAPNNNPAPTKTPASVTPPPVKLPDPPPIVTPVVKTLDQLGQTTRFCTDALAPSKTKLDLLGKYGTAAIACANEFGGKTVAGANSGLSSFLSTLLKSLGI